MRPHRTYQEALAAASPGEEIWALDASKNEFPYLIMTKAEADEYAAQPSYLKVAIHWETIKESRS